MTLSAIINRAFAVYAAAAAVFLVAPVLVVILVSFNGQARMSLPESGLSLRWYEATLASDAFLYSIGLSFGVAAITTVSVLLIGGAAAFAITRSLSPPRALAVGIFVAPLMMPATALAAALFLLFVLLGLANTFVAVVIGHIVVALPYVFRTLLTAMVERDRSLEEAAQSLGADRLTVFRRVSLPLMRPALGTATLFSLIISLDEFTITLFVGGRNIRTLPLEIYNFIEYGITPIVAAASTVFIMISAVVVWILSRWIGLRTVYSLSR